MSNFPSNPYKNLPATPPTITQPESQAINHNQPHGQVPFNQLPPGFGGIKQDTNSDNPVPPISGTSQNVNNYNSSASSSPAFNNPGISSQSSPLRPSIKQITQNPVSNQQNSNQPQYNAQNAHINDNTPPLIPSSQFNRQLTNGPPLPNQYPVSSNSQPFLNRPQSGPNFVSLASQENPVSLPKPANLSQPGPLPSPPRSSPMIPGLVRSSPGPPTTGNLLVSSGQSAAMNGSTQGKSLPVSSEAVPKMLPSMPQRAPVSQPQVSNQSYQYQNGPRQEISPFGQPGQSTATGEPSRPPFASQTGPPTSQSMAKPLPPIMSQPYLSSQPPLASGHSPIRQEQNSGQQTIPPPIGPQQIGRPPTVQQIPSQTNAPPASSQSQLPISRPPLNQPPVNVGSQLGQPLMGHLLMSQPSLTQPPLGQTLMNPSPLSQLPLSQMPMGQPPMSQLPLGQPPMRQPTLGQPPMSQPPLGQPLMSQPPFGQPPMSQPPLVQPPTSQSPLGQPPMSQSSMGQPLMSQQPVSSPPVGQTHYRQPPMPQQQFNNAQFAQMPPQPQPGPPIGPIQNRYPQMQSNYGNQNQAMQQKQQYSQQYSAQGITQQLGQLSVTKQGFDQLWGHNQVDLLQCRHILPDYPEDPPEIRLDHQFADAPNCSPEIFRCTLNRIPETNNLLQKSRLPLGILIHPFKDLNHLPVIQCSTIVRCRACRTYINPFVYFVDSKRWKCNLCYRVNDLPDEFQYDPVSKSYGDPSRRPEIKSATIEFIAPGEYMLRPPQPAVYLFLMDISQIGRESGYLQVLCDTLKNCLDQLPGDARTQVGFICYDAHVHYYLMGDGSPRPKEMTVLDIDEIFLPSPESLLVNLGERRDLINELLTLLPQRHTVPTTPASALGAALQAAYKLMAPTGGRITVFQTCLPNVGPGALQPREDPNARSSKEVNHLNPATDFYKRLALDCSGAQIAVDLFLLSSQYCDMATLSGMSKFSGGTVYHIPLFRAARAWQAECFRRMLTRYLTRKIGFEAVMRVRCTRGIAIHTFHGNFFVRSTDLLSLPNVSPDSGFGMQLAIEEALTNLQQVCFQAALLYTSSKGERRIRVHTLALPVATNLTEVLHSADQQAIIGLVSKMAVDRCASASMSEAREALMNVAIDALSAHKLAQNLPAGSLSSSLMAPTTLRLLPLYISALLKRKAFRTGTSTRLDDRVADMCDVKTLPLHQLLRAVYPDLYPIHTLREHAVKAEEDDEEIIPDPPRLQLSAEKINSNGAYLLDDGETMIIYVCHGVSPAFLSEIFGVTSFNQLPDETRSLPSIESEGNILLHAFIEKLNDDRPYASNILVLRDNSPNKTIFTERLVDDRVESAFSYYEFLQHIKSQVK